MKARQVLVDFLKRHAASYVAGIIILSATTFLSTLIPKILGIITDRLTGPNMSREMAAKYVVLMMALVLAVFLLKLLWRYFLIGNCRSLECCLRDELFAYMQSLPSSFYDNSRTGDLAAHAINDVQAVRMMFGFGSIHVLEGSILCAISIILMARTIDPVLTAMALAPIPPAVFAIAAAGRHVRERFRKVREAFAEISYKVQENISGIRVIKAFAQEEEEVENFLKFSKRRVDTQMDLTRISALLGPCSQLCFGISLVFFIVYGSKLVIGGRISLGDYVAFNTYMLSIMGQVTSISRIIEVWQSGIASFRRLAAIFDVPPAAASRQTSNGSGMTGLTSGRTVNGTAGWADGKARSGLGDGMSNTAGCSSGNESVSMSGNASGSSSGSSSGNGAGIIKGDIEIKNLSFSYPSTKKRVLKNVNIKLESGKTLGITGRSGSGKTTLANLLLRLYDVGRGHIFIDGTDINDIPVDTLRESIGFVPQDSFLFSTTIKSNIEFFRPVYSDDEIEEAAKLSGVYENIISFPDGFDTVVGERGMTLSGGQKQRISIARAIIKNPSILILDDSLSAVDTETEGKILENLERIMRNKTGIIISHRISTIKHADEIIFMDGGRIAERGTHEQLLEMKGRYYELYNAQTKAERGEATA